MVSKSKRAFHAQRTKRSKVEGEEIAVLDAAVAAQAPAPGTNPLLSGGGVRTFAELPLSRATQAALADAGLKSLTAIQRAVIPHALAGRDILGAAKTGSGKTVAFLVPLLERLYRERWGPLDGLGAIVISPTRELALQIFGELRRVGGKHDFSAGLLVGGRDVKEESSRVAGLNVLVCTPGRLLQHMDETPGFTADSLRILVLDEADRLLDLGFGPQLDAITANLPRQRQTILVSATQTRSVGALARVQLERPEYLAAHETAAAPTPARLRQTYAVVRREDSLDATWSFVRAHLRAKSIVFFSTCAQVRFAHEAFRKLRPGVPLRALHGRLSQAKRQRVFEEFDAAGAAVLLATDVAARGLDFRKVGWVVQVDPPEDASEYIHRVGRTARLTDSGKSLLLLAPDEEADWVRRLEKARVPVKRVRHDPSRLQRIGPALAALLSKEPELKLMAQKSLTSYLRSLALKKGASREALASLPVEGMAQALGLPGAPKLRFLRRGTGVAGGEGGGLERPPAAAGGAGTSTARGRDSPRANADADAGSDSDGGVSASGSGSGSDDDGSDSGSDDSVAALEARLAREEADGAPSPLSSDDEGGLGARLASVDSGAGGKRPRAPAGGEESESSSDDDLMVVKRREGGSGAGGAVGAASGEAIATGPALVQPPPVYLSESKKKRKKKLKIDPGRTNGTRVVFGDDEGDSDDEGGAGDRLADPAGAATASVMAARAEKLRAAVSARDASDRKALRDLKKAKRDEKRAKRLARERGAGAAAASLGGGGDGDASDDSDWESQGSDDDEDALPPTPKLAFGTGAKATVDKAQLDMAPRATTAGPLPTALADQEALALKLLAARRR